MPPAVAHDLSSLSLSGRPDLCSVALGEVEWLSGKAILLLQRGHDGDIWIMSTRSHMLLLSKFYEDIVLSQS